MSPEALVEVKPLDVVVPAHYLSYDEAVDLAEKIKTAAWDHFGINLGFFGIENTDKGAEIVFFNQPKEVAVDFTSILKKIRCLGFYPQPELRSVNKVSLSA